MRVFSTVALLFILSSCQFITGEKITGNGKITTQPRSVSKFSGIDVGGSMDVRILQDGNNAVRVETDENLMQYIVIENAGNRLDIHPKKGYDLRPTKDIIVYVSASVIDDIDVSGSSDVFSDGTLSGEHELEIDLTGSGTVNLAVQHPKVVAEISGSGNVTLKGRVTDFQASVSGSGGVHGFDLAAENATVNISGSGDVDIQAIKTLTARVSGSGEVEYKGNPAVNQSTSGSGSIRKVN